MMIFMLVLLVHLLLFGESIELVTRASIRQRIGPYVPSKVPGMPPVSIQPVGIPDDMNGKIMAGAFGPGEGGFDARKEGQAADVLYSTVVRLNHFTDQVKFFEREFNTDPARLRTELDIKAKIRHLLEVEIVNAQKVIEMAKEAVSKEMGGGGGGGEGG